VKQLQAAAAAAQVPPAPETRLEFSGAWSAWNQPFVLRYLMQRSTRCTSERAHVSRRYASNWLMIALKVAGFVPVQLQWRCDRGHMLCDRESSTIVHNDGGHEMKAQDIMSNDPVCVTPDTTLNKAAQLMHDRDVGMLPVVDGDGSAKLVGLITDRDITVRHVAKGHKGSACKVREAMSDSVTTCRTDDDVSDVMNTMGKEQIRRIPVVDERDMLVGVIAQADIVRRADNAIAADRAIKEISKP
jgi:CBS domain-containing protein